MGGIRAVGIVPGYVVMVPGFASFARGEGEEGGVKELYLRVGIVTYATPSKKRYCDSI